MVVFCHRAAGGVDRWRAGDIPGRLLDPLLGEWSRRRSGHHPGRVIAAGPLAGRSLAKVGAARTGQTQNLKLSLERAGNRERFVVLTK